MYASPYHTLDQKGGVRYKLRMILNNDLDQTLGALEAGECAEIIGFCAPEDHQSFMHRLYEVGFLLGEKLEVLGDAPISHNPMSIKVKDATYALRREDADFIRVKKISR